MFVSEAHYPGKLLLFGEHILLTGATALAVPVPAFYGKWVKPAQGRPGPRQQRLLEFAGSREISEGGELDSAAFLNDLQEGLFFESNIPLGYGLGSSGALCAGVYDRYAFHKESDPSILKTSFARMESFFHGNSSGLDPLTSYLNRPLLIEGKNRVSTPEIATTSDRPVVFLLDTGLPRKTGPLVQWFLSQYAQPAFETTVLNTLIPAHEQMVQSWIRGDMETFWNALKVVSKFQFDHFIPMVPATLRDFWAESLNLDDLALKICGAGGGGYLLGFTWKHSLLEALRTNYQLTLPFELVK